MSADTPVVINEQPAVEAPPPPVRRWAVGLLAVLLAAASLWTLHDFLKAIAWATVLARLRGFAGFSMPCLLSINGLVGKVCTTGVGGGRWLWRSAAVAVVATGA